MIALTYAAFNWYEEPLFYDIIFDTGTRAEGAFLAAVYARFVRSGGRRVLEPACGTGRLVAELARRGFLVTGFDASDGALRFARRRLRKRKLRARLVRATMEGFALRGPFDLAHCLVSTFKHLPTEAAARAHLRRIARALAPGGIYVLGLHLTDYADRARSRERWVADRDGVHVVCTIQGWPPERRRRRERVRCRLVARADGRERRLESEWWFRTYGPRQLRALLRSAPDLEHIETYDFAYDVDRPVRFGDRLDAVLILRRR